MLQVFLWPKMDAGKITTTATIRKKQINKRQSDGVPGSNSIGKMKCSYLEESERNSSSNEPPYWEDVSRCRSIP